MEDNKEKLQPDGMKPGRVEAAAPDPLDDALPIDFDLPEIVSIDGMELNEYAAMMAAEADEAREREIMTTELYDKYLRIFQESCNDLIGSAVKQAVEDIKKSNETLAKIINTPELDALKATLQKSFKNFETQLFADALYLAPADDELKELAPYLEKELQKPKYEGKTLEELKAEAKENAKTDSNRTSIEAMKKTLYAQALLEAKAEKDETEQKENPIKIKAIRANKLEFPIDKVNSLIWKLPPSKGGQILIDMASKQDKAKNLQVPCYYAIDFEDLQNEATITKKLGAYDKRVYVAAGALYNAGNEVFSTQQIYHAMGNKSTPSLTDRDKIRASIAKMSSARIFIDNFEESNRYNYEHYKYSGMLLPCETIEAIIDNIVVEDAIHLFREPPLLTFAKERKQVTTIDLKLLQSPVSKTDSNLLLEDYLLERLIRGHRKSTKSFRIIFSDKFYERIGAITKKQRQRTPAKLERYLSHYKKCEYIKDFTFKDDAVTIYF